MHLEIMKLFKPLTRTTANCIGIEQYDNTNNCFKFMNGKYFDIIKINTKDLINANDNDIEFDIMKFARFYKRYSDDLKIVSMKFPCSTDIQQENIRKKIKKTKNQIFIIELEKKINELIDIERNQMVKEFFLFYYADTLEILLKNRSLIKKCLYGNGFSMVQEISKQKKIKILYKLNNMQSGWSAEEYGAENNSLEKIINKKGYDPYLLEQIQPQGGISFNDEKFISESDGYVACLHVIDYPSSIDTHWLGILCNIDNAITTIDISTDNIDEVKKNLNKSINEQQMRYRAATDYETSYNAELRYRELSEMYDELARMGEVMKLIHIRVFTSASTRNELEEQLQENRIYLESNGYKAAVFLNELEAEWKSLYRPYILQQEQPYSVLGQPMLSEALAGGYPFHYSSLLDPYGDLIGFTPCGGPVIFDTYTKTKKRLSYNAVVIGKTGSGKSTLLKKQFNSRGIRSDFIRAFDATGEFTLITQEHGGKVIRLDGTNGILNPLEILRAGDNENMNFARHISKMHINYRFWVPGVDTTEINAFEEMLRGLYIQTGLIPETGDINKPITGLPSKDYPILSDLINYIEIKIDKMTHEKLNEMQRQIQTEYLKILNRVKKTLENITNTYGYLFNGHSSLDNIQDIQIVTFDISNIKNLKENVFDSLIFNIVSLCWDNAVANGSIMKKLYDTGKIKLDEIIHTVLYLDESHIWLNAKKLQALEQITIFCREDRKYFAGIWFASQSIRDYVPEDSSEENIDKLMTLFEITQYKFIFAQDSNSLDLLNKIFRNQLTQDEITKIPNFGQGENILVISGERNIDFKVYLTEEENRRFQGGA